MHPDELYEKAIAEAKANIDDLLESDSYYQALATPLKPASVLKAEHRRRLLAELEAKEMRAHLSEAFVLIDSLLPTLISPVEFASVKKEFAASHDQVLAASEKPASDRPQIMQQLFGLSNATLVSIYKLAYHLLNEKRFKEAQSVLCLLTFLAPDLAEFWLALGNALCGQDKEHDALPCYDVAKQLKPNDPAAFVCAAQIHLRLKQKSEALQELESAEKIIAESPELSRQWGGKIRALKNM